MDYEIDVTKLYSRRVIDPATYKMITKTKARVLTVEEYDERNDWCIENCEGKYEWVGGIVERHFRYTSCKKICFENEHDAMAFKLRWS
ncbi:hypothetical protein LCGC14_1082420 [marine sediment metagenome]|uniref:Uncharacterized protein n=1 Tax=marine sediment metagenome TaxID=412755 RepID=A0A0F9QKR0_9ZZZZ